MTFLNSLKKWFYTNNSSAAGSAARIPLLDAAGNAVGSDTYNAIAQIVRQELATILSGADQGTSGTAFPSIASGVLGSMTAANLASALGAIQPNGFFPLMSTSGGLLGLNSSIVKNVSALSGQSAISDDYFKIPYGATKVRVKAGSYNTKVYFYDSSRQYVGGSVVTTTEQEYDIPSGSVYILPSVECTPEQMLVDSYQITFLNYLGSYSDLSSLASALGGNLGIKRITTPEMSTGDTYTFSGIAGGLFLLANPSGLMGSMLAFVSYSSNTINYITRSDDFGNVSLSKQGEWSNVVLTNNTTRSASTHFEIIHIGIE